MAYIYKFYGPPGTGKTRRLLDLVQQEMANNVYPGNITYCSFTRAASYHARDLALERFPEFTKKDFSNFATIHSIAYRLLDLAPQSIFEGKALEDFAKTYNYKFSSDSSYDFSQDLQEMSIGTEADICEYFVTWQKNKMLWGNFDIAYQEFVRDQIDLPLKFSKPSLKQYMERREEYKRENGLWDFSDFLKGIIDENISTECKVLFLDEAQDSSPLLWEAVKIWSMGAERVYIAGDPYQAIFTWQGADPSLLINLKADKIQALRQSHRCPKLVHDLSRKIVKRLSIRYEDDDYLARNDEGIISKSSLEGIDFNLDGTTYIMARTRYLLQPYYQKLLELAIPFKTRRGWKSPLEKDESESVSTLYKLHNYMKVTLEDIYNLTKLIPQKPWLRRGAKTEIEEKAKDNPDHKVSINELSVLGFTPNFLDVLQSKDSYLGSLKIEDDERVYFEKLIDKYGFHILEEEPKLVLGTIHSYKGLESDNVVLDLGLTNRPYTNLISNPDEEHRVFYTACTRTKKNLHLVIPPSWQMYPL